MADPNAQRAKTSRLPAAFVAVGAVAVVIYLCSPLRTATTDPFARLWGQTLAVSVS